MRTARELDASAKRKIRLLFCVEKSRGCGQSMLLLNAFVAGNESSLFIADLTVVATRATKFYSVMETLALARD